VSIRVVTTGGPSELTYTWDGNPVTIGNGMLIDVEPGSDLETAMGGPDVIPEASAQQLASATNGGGGTGWVSN
jgi:hypothetical protein